MPNVTMRELLEAGAHFGHTTRRWNPKMKPYIFGARQGVYILDLQHTLRGFKRAVKAITDVVATGGTVLWVGTKRQAQQVVLEAAERTGMPSVTHRWMGGMLTNFQVISTRTRRLKDLEKMEEEEDRFSHLTKKERIRLHRERAKLRANLSGIKDMSRIPQAMVVFDVKKESNAVAEARKLHIPVVALVDTNCDPEVVDYCIPANDDALRSIRLFADKFSEAIEEGKELRRDYERQEAEAKALAEKKAADEAPPEEEKPAPPKKKAKEEKTQKGEGK